MKLMALNGLTIQNWLRLVNGLVIGLCMVAVLSGCSTITVDTRQNARYEPAETLKTRASEALTVNNLPSGVFIGIAMSGGGSRAANFSMAVLLELERLGILQQAAVISSVSGSSLIAAYYGLHGHQPALWEPISLREQFRTDFELPWIGRWFNPWNIVRYWFANLNRSDIMRQELDSVLFDNKQFKDMQPVMPRILINATSYTTGEQFVFSDEHFKKDLNSRLDTYPLANAVMASSSFPVVFHDITLNDYTNDTFLGQKYEHLIDGGPSDNLGVVPLVNMLGKLYQQPQKPKGCFLFVVDASTHEDLDKNLQYGNPRYQLDTRHWYDFILDTNVATSSDILLATQRARIMEKLGVTVNSELEPYVAQNEQLTYPLNQCHIWHLTFQRMYAKSFEAISKEKQSDMQQIRAVVNSSPTRYKLTAVEVNEQSYSPEAVQDYLFKAAHVLINEDKRPDGEQLIVRAVCEQMSALIKDFKCRIGD